MTLKDYYRGLSREEKSKLVMDLCFGLKISLYQFKRRIADNKWTPLEREVGTQLLKQHGHAGVEI